MKIDESKLLELIYTSDAVAVIGVDDSQYIRLITNIDFNLFKTVLDKLRIEVEAKNKLTRVV